MKKKEAISHITCGRGFPTFAVVVLALGVLWLLGDLGYIAANIPWIPIVLIVIAVGWIVNHYSKCK